MPRAAWPGPPLSLSPGQGGRASMEGLCPRPCLPALGLWSAVAFASPGPVLEAVAPYPWPGRRGTCATDCEAVTWACLGVGHGASHQRAEGLTFLCSLSAQNRGRLADKRTVALPPARVLKKELTPSFIASDGDSDGSGPACGQRSGLKQEDDTHIRIMKRRSFPRARAWRAYGLRCQMGLQGRSAGSWRQVQAWRGVLCPWDWARV